MNYIIGKKYKITFEIKGDFNKTTQVVRTYTVKAENKKAIILEDRWSPILKDTIIKAEVVEEGDLSAI